VTVRVITGANTGIGLETAKAFAASPGTIVMACRNTAKGEAAAQAVRAIAPHADVQVLKLDLADLSSVRDAADEIVSRWDRLDVLVNNAGGMQSERRTTAQGFEMTFGVNHLAHFYLTNRVLGRLKYSAPSRIVNVASTAHKFASKGMQWGDLQSTKVFKPFKVYGYSKLANILFTRELAHRLVGTGVTATCCHPGSVKSEFGHDGEMGGVLGWLNTSPIGGIGRISSVKGAETQVYLATSPEVATATGGYYIRKKLKATSKHGADDVAAKKLWDLSAQLCADAAFPIT
jgi:NAD(P)-dependent dehydrogenase (short-subunit alcohol dehydrogenase family)